MYTVTKRLEIAAAHRLSLNYESQCENLHGHNWIIYVTCRREELNENGMVVDFKDISNIVKRKLDHAYLNDVIPGNPTAENIAKWICDSIPFCVKVSVQESEGNVATYEV
ncbi:6-carboxytetrahydropterin synthase QueD [Megasphaera hexanoica]|uniref:6-carboxytetrahydropterin synthase QueD n=1 Tax=Megasphaera sp. An286 TaxID=1965622 RepID=UPI000B3BC5E2|nr:6-carboxytetrahydropterin synthase QueD [Megasphaera sp. An286]MDN0045544.1 6-carboxytetrahydropterin synthase QueD [Megasphaera hexanoica]OUO47954.1 6-carboxytetrahydropterin synthase QueD [Megasphaera sp. An286]